MINGLINVYKEKGYTSFDVVALMRGVAGQRKVGHTGTLDPDAEGVLPICLGSATKICDMLTDKKKEYVATFMLGKRTDTLDISGNVLEEKQPVASKESVIEAVLSFKGGYEQLPPMYSAKWVNGQRLYDLARKGKEVERQASFVEIYDIDVINVDYPSFTIRVSCGKGTYIRSLCEDIGKKVNEFAVMTSLKRTKVSVFTEEKSYTLSMLSKLKEEGRLSEVVVDTDTLFPDYKKVTAKPEADKLVNNGNMMNLSVLDKEGYLKDGELVRAYNSQGEFKGIYRFVKNEGSVRPYKMFLGEE